MDYMIIMAGIIGTLAMTLFVELIARLSGKPFRVIRVLAEMLRFGRDLNRSQRRTLFVGATILHYAIGVSFAFCYRLAIDHDILGPTWKDALLFGAAAGLVGIAGWRLFFAIHPKPPEINLFQFLTVIWLGHLVFACGMFLHVRDWIGLFG